MELANVLVALGGERGHTVPKWAVTPAETAVLMAIHGEDAVHEIQIVGDDKGRSARAEIDRLHERYKATDPDTGKYIVGEVFPGRNPDLPATFEALGLPDDLYKATERATPAKSKGKGKGKTAVKKETETDETDQSQSGDDGAQNENSETSILD